MTNSIPLVKPPSIAPESTSPKTETTAEKFVKTDEINFDQYQKDLQAEIPAKKPALNRTQRKSKLILGKS